MSKKTKFEVISEDQFLKDMGNIKYIYNDIKLPKRATKSSAGYDFYLNEDCTLCPGETIKVPTGIKVSLKEDQVLLIVPRSSLGFKYRLQLDNTVAVIDSDYYNNPNNEGHIWIKITNDSRDKICEIKKGEAFCQGIILNFATTCDDDSNDVRLGGLGSTNKNV